MRIFGVILAGGQGRRMGGADKALLPLAGRPLIRHVLDRLHPQVDQVLISANGDPARFGLTGCEVVPDAASRGPLSGIHAALLRAGNLGATHLVSTPVDTPFLPGDLVPQLLLAGEGAQSGLAFAADATGDHPATALWPVGLAEPLGEWLRAGGAKVTDFAGAQGAARAEFPDPRAFLNLNTPADLAAAEVLLRGAA